MDRGAAGKRHTVNLPGVNLPADIQRLTRFIYGLIGRNILRPGSCFFQDLCKLRIAGCRPGDQDPFPFDVQGFQTAGQGFPFIGFRHQIRPDAIFSKSLPGSFSDHGKTGRISIPDIQAMFFQVLEKDAHTDLAGKYDPVAAFCFLQALCQSVAFYGTCVDRRNLQHLRTFLSQSFCHRRDQFSWPGHQYPHPGKRKLLIPGNLF